MEETVEQFKELRVIEHEQMILDYISQVPILRIPTATHAAVVGQMLSEYNDKYFSQENKESTDTDDSQKKRE